MKLYGLIGFPLSHSFSKKYFEEKFANEGITNCRFDNFSLEKIEDVEAVLQLEGLQGFAITIPYKKKILAYLHDATAAVKEMNACNCVKIIDGKLYGYNTDVTGFETSLKKSLQPHHQKALILGTGGAAQAVMYALRQLGIAFLSVSRTEQGGNIISYESLTPAILQEYTLIINTTPLGTYPNVDDAPAISYEALTPKHYLFDLVYNPAVTKFLALGKAQGAIIQNGYDMLTIQAEANWSIWNSQDVVVA